MKKLKLALIGCGYLNDIVANACKSGLLPQYDLIAVLGRDKNNAEQFGQKYNCKVCYTIDELLDEKPDYIAESASVAAIKEYTIKILENKSNLIVLSIGAFADAEFYSQVQATAFENNVKVYIANGAVGGFDAMRTFALMGPITSSITSYKSPRAITHTKLYKEGMLDVKECEQIFSGTTKEAIAILPTHVNVAVATALASSGPENTRMNINILPNYVGDEYNIKVEGEDVKLSMNIYSRNSKVAGWSVVAVLQNIVSPIVF